MKNCVKTCAIFYILFLTYFFMYAITVFASEDLKKLDNVLDNKQKLIYEKIKKERLHHYLTGLGIGAILGFLVILTSASMTSKFCFAGIVFLFSSSIIYYVLPKSDYMIKHLDTEEQRLAWFNVSRNFMKKKIAGFALAVVLYFCMPMFF